MRKIKIIILTIFCLLLIAGCNDGEEEVATPEDKPVVEESNQLVLAMGTGHEIDLNLDSVMETLMVQHHEVSGASANVSYFVNEELTESVSELPGLEITIISDEYRVIPDESQPVLALYVAGKEEREVFFYASDEDMSFTYLGKITGEVDFFDLGEIHIQENTVTLDGRDFDLDTELPSVPLMYQDKDEALDYLGLPRYSIVSGFGEPEQTEQLDGEEKLVYLERDLEVYVQEGKIQRVCTASGSLLGIDVLQAFSEDDWRDYERYEEVELSTSSEEHKYARFDLDKHFVVCRLSGDEENMKIISLCVSLSELYQARVKEEHVLVDRFGNLLFAQNEDTWLELISAEEGWTDLSVLGYERENAVLFFQGTKSGNVGVYHYNLLDDQITKLADNPESAAFSGGMLTVNLVDGRKYFDLGGVDVTEEVVGPPVEETKVEFYVQSDTLFYLPAQAQDYLVLKDLTEYLGKEHETYKTAFDETNGLGLLEAYRDGGDGSFDLYLFLAKQSELKPLQEEVNAYAMETINGELLLVLSLDDEEDYACYDLYGSFKGYCDQTGQMVD